MKKTLVVLLTLVFVLGIAATALAAPANPFVDVPAKHWAYDAVSKLAKAGIVDGYGDGTFRGDRTMTRYEMAQIVAKAMARSDKADAENKALIDKLAVEFAAELNNLGVRVAALEKNTTTPYGPSVKVYGDSRTRYQHNPAAQGIAKQLPVEISENGHITEWVGPNGSNGKTYAPMSAFQERFRLNFDMQMNDTTFMQSRLTYQNKVSADNANDNTYGGLLGQQAVNLDYGFFQFKDVFAGIDFRIGRDYLSQGYGIIAGNTGGYDMAKFLFTAGKELKGWIAYGDIAPYIAYSGGNANASQSVNTNSRLTDNYGVLGEPAVNVTTANLVWTPHKDFQMTGSLYWSNTNNYNYKVWAVGAKGNLTPGLYLAGEYAKNTSDKPIYLGAGYDSGASLFGTSGLTGLPIQLTGTYDSWAVTPNQDQKTAYFIQLGYHHGDNNTNSGIDSANPGAFGLFVNYKHYGGQAIDWNNTSILVFENITDNFLFTNGNKGFSYGVQYVPVKWVRLTGTYEQMKSLDGSVTRPSFTYVRAEYSF